MIEKNSITCLLNSGATSYQTLEHAQRAAEESGSRVDQALNRLGLVSDDLIVQTWSSVTGIASIGTTDLPTAPPCADTLLPAFLRHARCTPLRITDGTLTLAVEDPLDSFTPAAVAARTGLAVELRLIRAGDLDAWLKGLPDDTLQAATPAASDEAVSLDVERLRQRRPGHAPRQRPHRPCYRDSVSDIDLPTNWVGSRLRDRINGTKTLMAFGSE